MEHSQGDSTSSNPPTWNPNLYPESSPKRKGGSGCAETITLVIGWILVKVLWGVSPGPIMGFVVPFLPMAVIALALISLSVVKSIGTRRQYGNAPRNLESCAVTRHPRKRKVPKSPKIPSNALVPPRTLVDSTVDSNPDSRQQRPWWAPEDKASRKSP
jgi:hypothetical protein